MGRGPPSHASEQMHPSHFQNDAIAIGLSFEWSLSEVADIHSRTL
jgi:hypothetical protein